VRLVGEQAVGPEGDAAAAAMLEAALGRAAAALGD